MRELDGGMRGVVGELERRRRRWCWMHCLEWRARCWMQISEVVGMLCYHSAVDYPETSKRDLYRQNEPHALPVN